MEKEKYYNVETLSTDGDKITLDDRTLKEFFDSEFETWKGGQYSDEDFMFNITIVEMTEKEFEELPEFQF